MREMVKPSQPRQKVRLPSPTAPLLCRPSHFCRAQYLHESRHRHAASRQRSERGQFTNGHPPPSDCAATDPDRASEQARIYIKAAQAAVLHVAGRPDRELASFG